MDKIGLKSSFETEILFKEKTISKKRKTYAPSFRAKVALAAYRGDKTIHELAVQFQVSSQQITKWKVRLLDRIEEIFQDDRSRKKEDSSDESTLFEQIGRLKMEVDFLKKIKRNRLNVVAN